MKRLSFLLSLPLLLLSSTVFSGNLQLPDKIFLRTSTETFNVKYYALTYNGNIWIKPIPESDSVKTDWAMLALPTDLNGKVKEISMDDLTLIATDNHDQLFTCQNMLGEIKDFSWTKNWGSPIWLGEGQKLPENYAAWDLSVITPLTDLYYFDPAMHRQMVGLGKVHTVFALNSNRRDITIIDPWLPNDYSYEVGGPYRGRFIIQNLRASGSSIFVINKYGDMFTRQWDFDQSGADTIFFKYSYDTPDQKLFAPIKLPVWDWVMQPKVEGNITDNISINKTGIGCVHRILRVEGTDQFGATGYYERDIADKAQTWTFHVTNEQLIGQSLVNKKYDSSQETLGPDNSIRFISDNNPLNGVNIEVPDFSLYNSPATFRIITDNGSYYDLLLHTTDTIRLLPAPKGLTPEAKDLNGAIEIPPPLLSKLDTLPSPVRNFITQYLGDKRYTTIKASVTDKQLKISKDKSLLFSFKTQ
ncbi:MAG: hypothetical protein GY750_17500 [Lentisphaerae bacterium]|nr:hypothetical protein [Lentisphaerota bacterium]MCP4103194.1 hypothetical protein [Lentisphaerota bacterium]